MSPFVLLLLPSCLSSETYILLSYSISRIVELVTFWLCFLNKKFHNYKLKLVSISDIDVRSILHRAMTSWTKLSHKKKTFAESHLFCSRPRYKSHFMTKPHPNKAYLTRTDMWMRWVLFLSPFKPLFTGKLGTFQKNQRRFEVQNSKYYSVG